MAAKSAEPDPMKPRGAGTSPCRCGAKHRLIMRCCDCGAVSHGRCLFGLSTEEEASFRRSAVAKFRCEQCENKLMESTAKFGLEDAAKRPPPPSPSFLSEGEQFKCCGSISEVPGFIRQKGPIACADCGDWYHAHCLGLLPTIAPGTVVQSDADEAQRLCHKLQEIGTNWFCPACSHKRWTSWTKKKKNQLVRSLGEGNTQTAAGAETAEGNKGEMNVGSTTGTGMGGVTETIVVRKQLTKTQQRPRGEEEPNPTQPPPPAAPVPNSTGATKRAGASSRSAGRGANPSASAPQPRSRSVSRKQSQSKPAQAASSSVLAGTTTTSFVAQSSSAAPIPPVTGMGSRSRSTSRRAPVVGKGQQQAPPLTTAGVVAQPAVSSESVGSGIGGASTRKRPRTASQHQHQQ